MGDTWKNLFGKGKKAERNVNNRENRMIKTTEKGEKGTGQRRTGRRTDREDRHYGGLCMRVNIGWQTDRQTETLMQDKPREASDHYSTINHNRLLSLLLLLYLLPSQYNPGRRYEGKCEGSEKAKRGKRRGERQRTVHGESTQKRKKGEGVIGPESDTEKEQSRKRKRRERKGMTKGKGERSVGVTME